MKYGSVCSGIEAATVAWHPLGWKPAFFSEIEKFPRAVLAHHYPDVSCHGDFTTIKGDEYGSIELLVGGTPCQSFSIAGLRKGFADDRGNLTLEFIRLAERTKPRWVVWENVPGVLSIDGGRAFGAFLGGLAECGYGFAYRVLDAVHFGVPQRRRRVFVVGYFGDWRPPAAVLFERESLRGDITPRRETGEEVAGTIGARTNRSIGAQDCLSLSKCLTAGMQRLNAGTETLIPCQGGFFDVASFDGNAGSRSGTTGYQIQQAGTLKGGKAPHVMRGLQVRRLTPVECERLQGFEDGYTLIPVGKKMAADGPRYKALGNSMAVPVMRWIGQRIKMVDGLIRQA